MPMSNVIESHKVAGQATTDVTIVVMDEKGPGGAHHVYDVSYDNNGFIGTNRIMFQKGPVGEVGKNGITCEALLAIVAHRLQSFQEGDCACVENQDAIHYTNLALQALKNRTARRVADLTEGTSQK